MPAIYTVSQVTSYIREALEGDPLLSDLFVQGEVSNLRVSAAGHSYFTLKDTNAVLNCVMFKGQSGADLLKNGTEVSTHGHLSFYEPRGSMDYMVDLAMPEGTGKLSLELEQLKIRLEAAGLFENSRKRPLPKFPQVIGIVTSPSGSVLHDIQNVISRRYPLAKLVLSPSQVQGDTAARNLVSALELLNLNGEADVIILARGGGALEELWPFNEEIVANAIFSSRIPVISGVGHETDLTIADLVADLRAPTPSAAAELAVPDQLVLKQDLSEMISRCYSTFMQQTEIRKRSVFDITERLISYLPDLNLLRRQIDDFCKGLETKLVGTTNFTQVELLSLQQRLQTLNPIATLQRGYAVIQKSENHQVVRSIKDVNAEEELNITLGDGQLQVKYPASQTPKINKSPPRPKKQPQMKPLI